MRKANLSLIIKKNYCKMACRTIIGTPASNTLHSLPLALKQHCVFSGDIFTKLKNQEYAIWYLHNLGRSSRVSGRLSALWSSARLAPGLHWGSLGFHPGSALLTERQNPSSPWFYLIMKVQYTHRAAVMQSYTAASPRPHSHSSLTPTTGVKWQKLSYLTEADIWVISTLLA